ncbi:DNA/RNA non-specific endonuclease [Hymenobacter sp. GOD-10R]|uniref:DNA/RNA non-specific endonuclease n=1 Tax=Hymenobacter sp. GOD-10R TaxID=3093922 RepID=UPI002D7A3ECB|nr:DNA/RNA non-specific endonuclease [Hymenobacter sp. GOD-10R]WRQ29130.1 DNA/RNA non-specific endonuclease [Hymenobacter sp. GOD-10R]
MRLLPSCSILLFVGLLTASCSDNKQTLTPATTFPTHDENLALGNPSGATTDASNYTNYLLVKPQYTLSYHRDRGTPNWVSWHLSSAWLGTADRQDNFTADNTLPTSWYRVTTSSYTGSGFDRGHNCPSADRTGSVEDNSATFLLSNIMPQAPNNNQRTWVGLENYCRTLVDQGNELYIICGSYGKGGVGSNGAASTLDNGHVTVPDRCWKVVVVLPIGIDDVQRVSTSTRVIAIDIPNDNSVKTDWASYGTTVDAIEQATGYDLLSAVSTSVQKTVEASVDTGPTN